MTHASSSDPAPLTVIDPGLVFARRETGDLLLDLYRPASADHPVPIVLWVHGGGWYTGDRTQAPDLTDRVRATGCAFASIDYRLSGQARFPAQLHDVRAAIRFLRAHAGEYGIDPRAVGVWGGSAGGHLAALAGLTGHLGALPGEQDTDGDPSVRAVVASYAPVDLAAVVAEARAGRPDADAASSPEGRLLGGAPAEVPAAARYACPLTWVHADAPPFQLSHGTSDALVRHTQSELLHDALAAAGASSELYLLDGFGHGFLNRDGGLDGQAAAVMDDGRLEREGTAEAVRRRAPGPDLAVGVAPAPARAQADPQAHADAQADAHAHAHTDTHADADGERTTFGFATVDDFLRRRLTEPGRDTPEFGR
ncbi:alpha/beta hydrolase fold domain-containing protein [Nocardiopsis aegyptia]|uniref:alpha/beta hydrolase fold domain-containing protein n=1 Tax=Nocardiopsis aegyptia TaxID=220378 RepID=UPI00367014CA